VNRLIDDLVGIYVDGVLGGEVPAMVGKFVSAEVTAHGFAGGAGRDAVIGSLSAWVRRGTDAVTPLRGLADGGWAVMQSYQSGPGRRNERVVFDLVRADERGRIGIWYQAAMPMTGVSSRGCSQIDGSAVRPAPADPAVVRAVVEFCRRDGGAVEVEHEPGRPGRRLIHVLAGADSAATLSAVDGGFAIEMWRVAAGAVVEHWGGWHVLDGGASTRGC